MKVRKSHKEKVCENCRKSSDEVVDTTSDDCDRNNIGCERTAKYIVVSSDYKPDYPNLF